MLFLYLTTLVDNSITRLITMFGYFKVTYFFAMSEVKNCFCIAVIIEFTA